MVVEGKVVDVMETWPLQLTLESAGSRYHITLSMDTAVIRDGEQIGMEQIRPGQFVRIEGRSSGEKSITAGSITLLEDQ